MNKETIEFIHGDPNLTSKDIEILQKYFHVNWKFSKRDHIYYIDPESGKAMCRPYYTFRNNYKYKFRYLTIETISKYVNRLQKQETDLDRRDQQSTSGIQCTPSQAAIASGHLEYRTIDFRRRSKAQIGKANLSF